MQFYQYVADTGMLPLYGFGISVESSFTVSCSGYHCIFSEVGDLLEKSKRISVSLFRSGECGSGCTQTGTGISEGGNSDRNRSHGDTTCKTWFYDSDLQRKSISRSRDSLYRLQSLAPKTGSDGSGYGLAKSLGHHLTPVVPALVQLRCKESFYKSISGVRLQGTVTLLNGSKEVASDTGEIQITDYGVSGIPVFQISRYAALGLYYKEPVSVRINFMPDFSAEQFQAFLENRIQMHPNCSMEHFFIGLFHKKMSAFFLQWLANISPAKQAGALTKTERAKALLIPSSILKPLWKQQIPMRKRRSVPVVFLPMRSIRIRWNPD